MQPSQSECSGHRALKFEDLVCSEAEGAQVASQLALIPPLVGLRAADDLLHPGWAWYRAQGRRQRAALSLTPNSPRRERAPVGRERGAGDTHRRP